MSLLGDGSVFYRSSKLWSWESEVFPIVAHNQRAFGTLG